MKSSFNRRVEAMERRYGALNVEYSGAYETHFMRSADTAVTELNGTPLVRCAEHGNSCLVHIRPTQSWVRRIIILDCEPCPLG